jgi:MSHA biogenesis protein MshI
LLGLLKPKLDKQALVAVCPSTDAVAIARVRRARDVPPVLELCEVHATASLSVQAAEIAQLVRSLGLERSLCATTLALGNYSLLFVEAPDVPPTELRAAIRWRVKDLIDFHIDDAVIDVFEVPDQKATGKNAMMYAVVARSSVVRQQIGLLTGAGLNLEVIDIPELALRNIASLLPEDVAGVALLYLSSRNGLITLTRQGTLYLSRRIETGWEMLAGDQDQMESKLDRVVVEIQRSLDYYESHFMQPAITNVVVTPLPDGLDGVAEYLGDQLGVPVRSMDIGSVIDAEQALSRDVQSRALVAIGAALRQETVAL